jgi:hypothetical protein
MMPQPPALPFPPLGAVSGPVDPGSLKVQDTVSPDGAGAQHLVRRKTWTSGGIQHDEVTVISPAPQATAADANSSKPESTPAGPSLKSTSQSTAWGAAGAAVSVDSRGQTRVYQYQSVSPAPVPAR